jgi:hypothetical protein
MVILLLPRYHRDTLEVLLVFLKWVASFSHVDEETGSKMDLGNLATVITPSILKANKRDGIRDESFTGIKAVTQLLEEQDELYLVPEEFTQLLADQGYFTSCMDNPRELLKKIDTFLRIRHANPANRPHPTPNGGYMGSPPQVNRSNYEHYGPTNGNGGYMYERPGFSHGATEYNNGSNNNKVLPPHPGLPHQQFSSPQPHPGSRMGDPGPPRPSLDNFWAPPPNPATNEPQRSLPNSRPSSFIRPNNESNPAFGSIPASRNSPLGA